MSDNLRDDIDDVLWTHGVEPRTDVLDALMPVVREHLAQAKADEYRRAYRIGYDDGRRRHGWISDAASAAAYDPWGYFEWSGRDDHLREALPEDRREGQS